MARRLLIGVLFGVLVYAGILFWIDLDGLKAALARIQLWPIAAAIGLSLANYLIRFLKWERYRRLLRIDIEGRTSFLIYLCGFSMGVTPGKMGEVLKSWLIRQVSGVPIHQSAPIVVAERLTDLLGYLILVALGGIASHPEYAWVFWATLGVCLAFLLLAGSETFARLTLAIVRTLPYLGRIAHKVEGAFASTRTLLSLREILFPTVISVLSWGCECLGFWLIANAFLEEPLSLEFAVFTYAISALLGAVAIFLPGGLGLTEFSLGTLLRRRYEVLAGVGIEGARSMAAGAVLITRGCTLWFSLLVGLAATALFQRLHGRVDVEATAD